MYPREKYSLHTKAVWRDAEYSINLGIQNLASCLKAGKATSEYDIGKIKLALQSYNYGNGYLSWAVKKDGGYTKENALEFSSMMAQKKGGKHYGDPQYVEHVLRYYSYGQLSVGENQNLVQIALSQEGNKGGKKYWSWYGFKNPVNWCACFVSWCTDQSGMIASGQVPKFSSCSVGANWFQEHDRWKGNGYTPAPGNLIFFDWNKDGHIDHVGIVVSVGNGRVNTIEGNSSNMVARRSYELGKGVIVGYGV